MKKATQRIIEKFPMFKEKLNDYENIFLSEEALQELDEIQKTFLGLACFFEEPEKISFDLGYLYRSLDNDWLEFALELMTEYFREDTYLIQKPSYSLIKDGSDYFSLTQFAEELSNRGLRYDRQKLNLYFERGKVPQPDLVIGGVKYWSKKTVQLYGDQEERRLQGSVKGRNFRY
ncbi:hypothetical protein AF332_27395 [Sporosarcina globispora]|uniref:Uncharacterized protein n=1 Tax=Sporosarcina globispora TaxID=1459 RepID=A0A0M0G1N4_SPOGL|nr:hypothetical protein [Sporosarcina globispora]KON83487.1 hypothetical protein AF332_27395 [Sporosarcina globispora]